MYVTDITVGESGGTLTESGQLNILEYKCAKSLKCSRYQALLSKLNFTHRQNTLVGQKLFVGISVSVEKAILLISLTLSLLNIGEYKDFMI